MKINGVEESDIEELRNIVNECSCLSYTDRGLVVARVLLAIIEPANSSREKVETKPE